jgi:NAD(P)H-nitrite reductase large subunit
MPDRRIFSAVNDCGIVFDGRIVVDRNLRTADANVYACGSVAKVGACMPEYCCCC